jgi:hypothetical protein
MRVSLLTGVSRIAGPQTVLWDGRTENGAAAPSGVYFCRLAGDGVPLRRKITRVR